MTEEEAVRVEQALDVAVGVLLGGLERSGAGDEIRTVIVLVGNGPSGELALRHYGIADETLREAVDVLIFAAARVGESAGIHVRAFPMGPPGQN